MGRHVLNTIITNVFCARQKHIFHILYTDFFNCNCSTTYIEIFVAHNLICEVNKMNSLDRRKNSFAVLQYICVFAYNLATNVISFWLPLVCIYSFDTFTSAKTIMFGSHWVRMWHCYLWRFVALCVTSQKCFVVPQSSLPAQIAYLSVTVLSI